jgi:2,5-diketo-D-gluconate reductase B
VTELDLPPLGLGTANNDDPETCARTVVEALDVGYQHVDTAQMYGNEAAVGDGLARSDVDREEVVLATKVHPDNLAPDDVVASTRESLDRLGVDAVDLLYVHWPTGAYDPEATLPAFDEVRETGLTEHVGVSNFTPDLLAEAREILDAPIAAHQVECHPLLRQGDLRALARDHDHHLVAYSPLARGEIFDDPVLESIAEKHGVSVAQVCLAWGVAQESVVPIPKATGEHVVENVAALEVDLDDDDLARIDAIDAEHRLIDPDDAPWH